MHFREKINNYIQSNSEIKENNTDILIHYNTYFYFMPREMHWYQINIKFSEFYAFYRDY